MVQHQKDCLTKEECGCFYYCCNQCEFYVKKGKDGKEIFHRWDSKKNKHVVNVIGGEDERIKKI